MAAPVITTVDSHQPQQAWRRLKLADSGLGSSLLSSDVSSHDFSSSSSYDISERRRRSSGSSWSGPPPPVVYTNNALSSNDSYYHQTCDDNNILLLNDSNVSDSGITDLLASIENDLVSSDNGGGHLLKTPMRTGGRGAGGRTRFTSTPVKPELDNSQWISPIRGFPSSSTSWLFSPTDRKSSVAVASTPLDGVAQRQRNNRQLPLSMDNIIKEENVRKTLPVHYTLGSTGLSPTRKQSGDVTTPTNSPKLGSLSSLGLVGLTPHKSPKLYAAAAAAASLSPTFGCSDTDNQSFGKLLGELQLEGLIEDGINLDDVSNISFSNLKCDF